MHPLNNLWSSCSPHCANEARQALIRRSRSAVVFASATLASLCDTRGPAYRVAALAGRVWWLPRLGFMNLAILPDFPQEALHGRASKFVLRISVRNWFRSPPYSVIASAMFCSIAARLSSERPLSSPQTSRLRSWRILATPLAAVAPRAVCHSRFAACNSATRFSEPMKFLNRSGSRWAIAIRAPSRCSGRQCHDIWIVPQARQGKVVCSVDALREVLVDLCQRGFSFGIFSAFSIATSSLSRLCSSFRLGFL